MDSINNHSCSICLGLFINPVTTKCGHIYCKGCLEELIDFEQVVICPLCRKQITNPTALKVDIAKEQYIIKSFPQEYARRQVEVKQQEEIKKNTIKLIIEYGNTHSQEQDPKQSKSNPVKQNSHDWCCFVRLNTNVGSQSDYIQKIEFKLHETFAVPLISVDKAPYKVSRKGWGTFQIPIKIYWKSWMNMPLPTELTWNLQFSDPEIKKTYTIKINKDLLKNIPQAQAQKQQIKV